MARNDHSPQPAPREVVRRDAGAWMSGPALYQCDACRQDVHCFGPRCACCNREPAGAEPVRAEHVMAGDGVLIDGTQAEVTDVRHGDFWMNTGQHAPGVALGWRSGSSSGVMFRLADDILHRIT